MNHILVLMLNKKSISNKKRWARIPKAERSEIMSEVSKKKWINIPISERRKHSKIMRQGKSK